MVVRNERGEVLRLCVDLTIMQFAMILVSGIQLLLVALVDYRSVATFSVAASVIALVSGLPTAFFAPLVQRSAYLRRGGRRSDLLDLAIGTSRQAIAMLLLLGLPLWLAAEPLLHLWVGSDYAAKASIFLMPLLLSAMVRLSLVPVTAIIVGSAETRAVRLQALTEGIGNLAASIVLVHFMGPVGIAWGCVFGACCGVAVFTLHTVRQVDFLAAGLGRYLRQGLVLPASSAIAIAILSYAGRRAF